MSGATAISLNPRPLLARAASCPALPRTARGMHVAFSPSATPPSPTTPGPATKAGRYSFNSADKPFVVCTYATITTSAGTVAHIPIPLVMTGDDAKIASKKDKELRDLLLAVPDHSNCTIKSIDYSRYKATLFDPVSKKEKIIDLKDNVQYETLIREVKEVCKKAAAEQDIVFNYPTIGKSRGDVNGPLCLYPATERLQRMCECKFELESVKKWAVSKNWFEGVSDDEKVERITRAEKIQQFLTEMPHKLDAKIESLKRARDAESDEDAKEAIQKQINKLEALKEQIEHYKKFALYGAALLGDSKAEMVGDMRHLKGALEELYLSSVIPSWNEATKQEMEFLRDVVLLRAKDRVEFADLADELGRAVTQDAPEWNLFRAVCAGDAKQLCNDLNISGLPKALQDEIQKDIKEIFDAGNQIVNDKITHIIGQIGAVERHAKRGSLIEFTSSEKEELRKACEYARELGLSSPFKDLLNSLTAEERREKLKISDDEFKEFGF